MFFVASLGELATQKREGQNGSRSGSPVLDSFDGVVNGTAFAQTPVILFLNKIDLLKVPKKKEMILIVHILNPEHVSGC